MEDLLASIRKAIHEDIGDVPATAAPAKPRQEQARPLSKDVRSRPAEEVSAVAAEIQELRERINRSRATDARLRELSPDPVIVAPPPAPPPPQAVPAAVKAPRATGFAGILGGDIDYAQVRRAEAATPPQALRPSFAEADTRFAETPRREPQRRFSREAETDTPAIAEWREEPAAPPAIDPGLLSAEASAAAGAAFNRLADTLLSRATGERSIEDMTRELLRGMLKQYLDEHLPVLVESLVREEIERVARRGR